MFDDALHWDVADELPKVIASQAEVAAAKGSQKPLATVQERGDGQGRPSVAEKPAGPATVNKAIAKNPVVPGTVPANANPK